MHFPPPPGSSPLPTRLVAACHALILTLTVFCGPSLAQFASPPTANLTTIASPVDPNVTVSYTVPTGVCTTAFETQQQYTGWVSVPGAFPTNVFFWFVAARQPTADLTIWLNGGPGSSSMFGFFDETGPCEVVELGADVLGTVARDWGWDRASNMLFIDQPNQVGLSYDVATNGSWDLVEGFAVTPPEPVPTDRTPLTFINGTFGSLNVNNTANTSETAAYAIWHMLQGFLGTFPQYNPNNSALGVSLFAESYGGKYGPTFAEVWEEQNALRRNGSLSNTTLDINLVSLGIMNGCVDDVVQGPSYVSMAVNNTYGLSLLSPLRAELANATFYQTGGCLDLINQCRNASAFLDPINEGNVSSVNSVCAEATSTCQEALLGPYGEAGRSYYDIAHQLPESFPPSLYIDYLNSESVLGAIGSIVNYTDESTLVQNAFLSTGDYERGPMVPRLASLLNSGVRVALVYGDRDYICNWLGGQAVSMSVAAEAGGAYASEFPSAGYAPIIVNDSYIGGEVRQFGNLSFSRIFQSGHFVPAYQPETAFQVFARIVLGTSLSTGETIDLRTYNTTGPLNATSSLALPPSPSATCYLRSMAGSCPSDSISSILAGQGIVINGVWYASSSEWPGSTVTMAPSPATVSVSVTSTVTLTGVFTATTTPKISGAARTAVALLGALIPLPLVILFWIF